MRPLHINCSLIRQPKQTFLTVNMPRSHGQMKIQLGNISLHRGGDNGRGGDGGGDDARTQNKSEACCAVKLGAH